MSATVYATLRRSAKTFAFLFAAPGAVMSFARRYLEFCLLGFIFVYSNVIQKEGRGPERCAADLCGSSTVKQKAIKEHA